MPTSYSWTIANKGIASNSAYPYASGTTGSTGSCQSGVVQSILAPKSCVALSNTNISTLKAIVNKQPVSIGVQGDQDAFYNYQYGILDDVTTCGTALNHAVIVVGYGICDNGVNQVGTNCNCASPLQYWLVKNSWGSSWGVNGYGCILMSSTNVCGVLTAPSYPLY